MSERLTDKTLARFCTLVDLARKEGDEYSEAGMALDDFLDSNVKLIADELKERRAADLSIVDRNDLEYARATIRGTMLARHSRHDEKCERAIAVLDRLIGGGQ